MTASTSGSNIMIDEKLVHLARNAMIVAGMEMGKEGDHWPVIKANIHAMMRDYEQLKIETAVYEELREHLGSVVKEYERILTVCRPATREKAEPLVQELREIYEAAFAPINMNSLHYVPDEGADQDNGDYTPWKSSAFIISGLAETQNGHSQ